ncbi:MAG TPA: DNA gyrase subunit A [Candidatus Thermoplasmatota archaeon]|nr:DNA gyrase subunit A [Candidatus Thermoplasmatota archaeon]
MPEQLIQRPIEVEMKTSYIDYAMSVIVGRALPDVRDGLKPVHRRILYGMWEMGLQPEKPTRKSARVVGDVMGKFHPHGDMAIYDAVVRMAQTFSLRYPLITGQGNFGSVDGDNPAAMRYTEVKLAPIARELLEDIDEDTVGFVDNYDASEREPSVLPGKLPNLLVNGSSGIAVGMATNVPPHNLREIVDAIVATISNPQITIQELAQLVPGPDFPTGGIITGKKGILEAYATGRGIIRVRAKCSVEEHKDRERIIVTELPYQVNKAKLLQDIAALVREKKLEDIGDLRDESDRDGMRVVIELKRAANSEVVLNNLYAHTALESSFGILNLALVANEPKVLTIKGLVEQYIDHRVVVVTRRTKFRLKKAEDRAHIVEGLLTALDNIDAVIHIIRGSRDTEEARSNLMAGRLPGRQGSVEGTPFTLTEPQAKAILEMRLSKLTSLETQSLKDELAQLRKDIAFYREILGDRAKLMAIIVAELKELKDKYGDDRRTQILEGEAEIFVEDLIPDEPVVVMSTHQGYVKRVPLADYRSQGRGGKGLIGMETKDEDFVVDVFVTTNHHYILFITNRGQLHWLKAYRIPEGTRYSKGKAIVNLLQGLEEGEKVQAAIPVRAFPDDQFLFFATKKGLVKKTELSAFSNVRVSGIRAIQLEDGDELVGVDLSSGADHIVLAKAQGQSIRFTEEEVRAMGRTAYGVKGVGLDEGDEVVALAVLHGQGDLLTVKASGKGKRTPLEDYPVKHRATYGQITIKTDDAPVVAMLQVEDGDEILATTQAGIIIRVPTQEIPVKGRIAAGNWIIRPEAGDKVIAVARLRKQDLPETAEAPPPALPDARPPGEAAPQKPADIFPKEQPEPEDEGEAED